MADELWVGFWGIDHEGMPYASVEKFNPKKHDKKRCEIRKELFPNPKEAINAVLIGLTAEKAHMAATFDEVMFDLVARQK